MRRLARLLLNLLTLLSLVLCVATVGLYVTSFWWECHWSYNGKAGRGVTLTWLRGQCAAAIWDGIAKEPGRWPTLTASATEPDERLSPRLVDSRHDRLGLGLYWRVEHVPGIRVRELVFPQWVIVVPFGMLPVARGWLWRRVARPGLCPTCGYDLRATPDRCPECGTIPHAPSRRRSD